MFEWLRSIVNTLLLPLSFLPAPVSILIKVVVGAFVIYWLGRLLKWLWDALPAI